MNMPSLLAAAACVITPAFFDASSAPASLPACIAAARMCALAALRCILAASRWFSASSADVSSFAAIASCSSAAPRCAFAASSCAWATSAAVILAGLAFSIPSAASSLASASGSGAGVAAASAARFFMQTTASCFVTCEWSAQPQSHLFAGSKRLVLAASGSTFVSGSTLTSGAATGSVTSLASASAIVAFVIAPAAMSAKSRHVLSVSPAARASAAFLMASASGSSTTDTNARFSTRPSALMTLKVAVGKHGTSTREISIGSAV